MSKPVLDRFIEERNQTIAAAEAFIERAGDSFDPADESYKALRTRAEELNTRIADLNELQETKAAAGVLDGKLSRSNTRVEVREQGEPQSFGEMFVRSAAYTGYRFRGAMEAVELDGYLTRAALETTDFKLLPTRREIPDLPIATPVQDSATVVPVNTNTVDVISWALTSAAAVVAESGQKPESSLAETVTPVSLETVAHHISFTRQLAEDSAAVRAKIDSSMRRGVLLKLESQAAAAVVGGTYGTAITAADLLAGVREGMGELQAVGYSPSTVYLNPADWAALDVANQAQQTIGLTGVVRSSYWGLTVVPLAGLAEGTALVADSRAAFEVYRRTGVNTYMTDSHAGNFTLNILTLLAEARQKTVVVDPNAVRKITVTP